MNQAARIEQIRLTTSFLWLVLALVWIVSALRTERTVQSQSSASQLLYTAILVAGVYLIFAKQSGIQRLDRQLFSVTVPIALTGLLIVLIGVAFSIWARLMLGSNWSNRVTVKENHTLVRTGPHRIVRHPIYSGILLGMLGSALERGGIRCFVAVLICGLSFWLKTLAEERFMCSASAMNTCSIATKLKRLARSIF